MPLPPLVVTFAVPAESRAFRHPGARLVHTGIGLEAAGRALRAVLAEGRPAAVIGSGFAGSLDPALRAGALIADRTLSDPRLLAAIPTGVERGRFASIDFVVETPLEKARLRSATGAAAAEMESAALAAACAEAGVPFLALRIISDAANESLPLPFSVAWDRQNQRARHGAIALHLLRHPGRSIALARFLLRLPMLQRRLATALAETLDAVEKQPQP